MSLSKIFVNTHDSGFNGIPAQELGESTDIAMSQKTTSLNILKQNRELGNAFNILDFKENGYLNSEGVYTPENAAGANKSTGYIFCRGAKTAKNTQYINSDSPSYPNIAFYDDEYNVIEYFHSLNEVTVPQDAEYCVFVKNNSNTDESVIISFIAYEDSFVSRISDIMFHSTIDSVIIDQSDENYQSLFKEGFYISNGYNGNIPGNLYPDNTWTYSELIEIPFYCSLINLNTTADQPFGYTVAFYNNLQQFISGSISNFNIKIPQNTKYIRVCFRTSKYQSIPCVIKCSNFFKDQITFFENSIIDISEQISTGEYIQNLSYSEYFTHPGYLKTDGYPADEEGETPNHRTDYIKLPDDAISVQNQFYINIQEYPNVAFYTNDLVIVSFHSSTLPISIPQTAKYVVFAVNSQVNSGNPAVINCMSKSLDQRISSLETKVSIIEEKLDFTREYSATGTTNIFTEEGVYISCGWNSTTPGGEYPDVTYNSSPFMRILGEEHISFAGFSKHSIYSYAISFYDNNKTFISGLETPGSYQIPASAKFFRACYKKEAVVVANISIQLFNDLAKTVENLQMVDEELIENQNILNKNISDINNRIDLLHQNPKNICDVNILLVMGQSLGVGSAAGKIDLSGDYETTIEFNTNTEIPFTDISSDIASDTLIQSSTRTANSVQETPVRGMVQGYIKQLKKTTSLNALGMTPMIVTIGSGGISLAAIDSSWSATKNDLKAIVDKVHSQGKTVSIVAMSWWQGEADNRVWDFGNEYYEQLDAYFTKLSDYIMTITDQIVRPMFTIYQTSGYESFNTNDKKLNIAQKQYELQCNRPDVYLTSPTYPYSFYQDLTHVLHNGTRLGGAAAGVYAAKLSIEGKYPDKLMLLKHSVFKSGTTEWTINLDFSVPEPPLVFDHKNVENPSEDKTYSSYTETTSVLHQGFSLMTHSVEQVTDDTPDYYNQYTEHWTAPSLVNYTEQNIITDVSIVRGTSIKIKCSSDPTGLELWYARRGIQGGGYVHDSQDITLRCSDVDMQIYNWLPTFMVLL